MHRFCVAPMMKRTDPFCRLFYRLLTRHAVLYSEMVSSRALRQGAQLLERAQDHPVALQLGGDDPAELAYCARLGEQCGYSEINFNVGCPSVRAQEGRVGVILMREPHHVVSCYRAMQEAVAIPVSIKHRLGIVAEHSQYEYCRDFVGLLMQAGCRLFIVHARHALLGHTSTRHNRSIPPLLPHFVVRLKQEFAAVTLIINGGISTHAQIATHLQHVDGVMLGRAVYRDPWTLLATVDSRYYAAVDPCRSRFDALYQLQNKTTASLMQQYSRHLMGITRGMAAAKQWRRALAHGDPSLLLQYAQQGLLEKAS